MKQLILIYSLISGCTSIDPESIDLPINLLNNRASMEFKADGVTYNGTATLKRRPGIGTKIEFQLPEGTILFQLDNCAREVVTIRPKKDTVTYHYRPSLFKEAEDSCMMQAQATTFRGEMLTAMIDWTDHRRLPAKIWCNEDHAVPHTGVGFCQNRAGKLMWIEFEDEVVTATENCPEPKQAKYHSSNKVYEINIKSGLCAYGFMSKSRERFRLTTYGYTTNTEVNLDAMKGE
jgi:hypothetical protein